MSVLIKGMKMPKNCWNCPFFHTSLHNIGDDELLEKYTCLRTGERTDENVTGYMKNCPLIELPPHGRLIDADVVAEEFEKQILYQDKVMELCKNAADMKNYFDVSKIQIGMIAFRSVLNDTPTIIPAEGKEE